MASSTELRSELYTNFSDLLELHELMEDCEEVIREVMSTGKWELYDDFLTERDKNDKLTSRLSTDDQWKIRGEKTIARALITIIGLELEEAKNG